MMMTRAIRSLGLLLGLLPFLVQAAPTVSLSAPANAASYLSPATLTVTASASPSAGTTITQVEFYQGSTLIGTDTASPYGISWTPTPGNYTLTAKATDSAGGITTSAARTLTINGTNAPPTVSLSVPAASYLAPATVTLTATANGVETNTPITQVEILDGAAVLATLTVSPYVYTWSNVPVGPHSLTARATDSAGGVTTSAVRLLTINGTNAPPTVSLLSPAANASYTLPTTVMLTASANGIEANTPITQVEFYQGTTLIGKVISSPYSVLWSPTAPGSYSLTAKATDSAGGVTTSLAKNVTLKAASASQVYYLHTDHLNTPRLVTDANNTIVWRHQPLAEPFGNSPPEEDPDGNGTPFTLNLRFPGQYFDKESNLSYNYFRDYNPAFGRYIQSDPVGLQGGINTYGYVGGNPLKYTDPRGLNPVAGAIAGAEVGTAVLPGPGTVIGAGLGLLGGYLIADQFGNLIFAKPKPGSKPKGCPTGTKPIDQIPGLDKDDVHGIKDGVGAGPMDWTGIAPNGDVITGDGNGDAVNHGPYSDYLP